LSPKGSNQEKKKREKKNAPVLSRGCGRSSGRKKKGRPTKIDKPICEEMHIIQKANVVKKRRKKKEKLSENAKR